MGQRQQLQFRPEFKADAVAPLWSPGRPVAAITDELGIGEPELSYWLKRTGRAGRRRIRAGTGRLGTLASDIGVPRT